MIEWVRFGVSALLMLMGLSALFISTFGVFRFKYVLNRIHVAAKCDTAGMLLCIGSMIIMNGFNITSLRLLLIVIFIWIANPVSSHLIAYLEVATNPRIDEEFEVIRNDVD